MKTYLFSIFLFLSFSFIHLNGSAQCTNTFAFGSATAPTNTTPVTINSCVYQGDYSTISNIIAGNTYSVSNSCGGYVTVRRGAYNGTLVANGNAPLTFTAPVSGTYYIHWNTGSGCGIATNCCTTTITCTSCGSSCSGTQVTLNMFDSWGDGWNGAQLTINGLNTGAYGPYTLSGGSSGSTTICLPDDCYSINISGGTYPSEVSWTITNGATTLASGGAPASLSNAFSLGGTPCTGSGPVNAGDCTDAIDVCTNLNFSIDPNGYGNVDELCYGCFSNPSTNPASTNSGCLLSGELNSTWMVINVATTGTLQFSFGALSTSYICYDWIMWPYNSNTCSQIFNNTIAPVRCNWNAPCEAFTGIGSPPPAGGDPGNFEPNLNVTAGDQFIVCFSNYSSTTTSVPLNFYGSASISCTPLPIVLLDFSAECKDNFTNVSWTTATEINNDYFELEKSYDAVNFVSLGTVKGSGNSHQVKEYQYTDYETTDKTVYYRLKQVDFDGQVEVFDIIPASCSVNPSFEVNQLLFNDNQLNFNITTSQNQEANIQLLNAQGQLIKTFKTFLNIGVNQIKLENNRLCSGIYMLNIVGEKNHYSTKIFKQ